MEEKGFKKNSQILVVDDATGSRKLLIKKLKDLGFSEFHEARDGAHALEFLDHNPGKVDLIISDINMPNMNGIELLKRVRSTESLKDIPFFIVTAELENRTIMEAMNNGVNNYLIKPVEESELREKLLEFERPKD